MRSPKSQEVTTKPPPRIPPCSVPVPISKVSFCLDRILILHWRGHAGLSTKSKRFFGGRLYSMNSELAHRDTFASRSLGEDLES